MYVILKDVKIVKLITHSIQKSLFSWHTAAQKCLNRRQDSTRSVKDKETYSHRTEL